MLSLQITGGIVYDVLIFTRHQHVRAAVVLVCTVRYQVSSVQIQIRLYRNA